MANAGAEALDNDIREQAAQHTLAANPLVGVRSQDILDSARLLLGQMKCSHPAAAAQQYLVVPGRPWAHRGRWLASLHPTPRIGVSPTRRGRRARPTGRWRRATWRGGNALHRFLDDAKIDKRDAERTRFVVSLVVDAMSPTNSLAGNPAALKRLVDTGGASLVHGLENFVGDLVCNGGLPAQVDRRKFAVGKNPQLRANRCLSQPRDGADPVPVRRGSEVHERPLLIAPPQINKFYVFDLVPEKSIIQYCINGGLQTFVISWKNPTPAESDFGIDTYVGALEEAVDAMREVTGSARRQHLGLVLGRHYHVGVSREPGGAGEKAKFIAPPWRSACSTWRWRKTRRRECSSPRNWRPSRRRAPHSWQASVEGQELARMFAWMRPNDLIWNYWVNNYLLGNAPPAFDILYWNNDTTRLPARLHADFLDLIDANPYVNAGRLKVCGMPLDMRRLNLDSYVVGGLTDHITPWQGCYGTAKLYGERSTFVLVNSGHIQSLLNPPGNPKACFWTGGVVSAEGRGGVAPASGKAQRQLVAALARLDQSPFR